MSIRFGMLSTAKIAKVHVIPAMKRAAHVSVTAIASRDAARARKVADDLDIPVSYGSYEELLQSPEVDAVYIPLPNHLQDRKSTRLNSSHVAISYAVFFMKKKTNINLTKY